ncbi:MAG TPA: RHS repeat-associated core domain-containing protein [Pyrinomonadaceae bacterium]|nr:RHS repeat-associated core domain-containing protein [Pyrinomonadaceae bacterium]
MIRNILVAFAIFFAGTLGVQAQPAQQTAGKADKELKGSGRINPSTLAMEFSVPLGNYAGRGISMPVTLNYSSKLWRMEYVTSDSNGPADTCVSYNLARFGERTSGGWTSSLEAPYIERTGDLPYDNFNAGSPFRDDECNPHANDYGHARSYIPRLLLHLPGGETHELRSSDSPGGSVPGDGTYYAVDSSNIRYVQDSGNGLYRVQMPDGSYYDLGSGTLRATAYTDRNGNSVSYSSSGGGSWTDTLGRTLDLPVNPTVSPTPGSQAYSVPGLTGEDDITYTLHWKELKGSTAGDSALTDFGDDLRYVSDKYLVMSAWYNRAAGTYLFASGGDGYVTPDTIFNPVLLTQIDLPNGLSYKFSYNVWGEIDKVVYPTGGEETFTYGTVAANSFLDDPYAGANRGVLDRKLYKSSTDMSPYEWTYSSSTGSTTTVNPDGTRYERYMHLSAEGAEYGFDSILAGMPYEERTYTSDGHLVLRKLTHWVKNDSGSNGAEWHPRVDYDETIAYDTSGNGVSAVTKHEYYGDLSYKDTPVLENKTTTYAFMTKSDGASFSAGTGPGSIPAIPTSTPSTTVRVKEVTYMADDSNYTAVLSNYTDQNLYGLVTVAKVKDGSGTVVGQAETAYDESGRSPGYRGNPTTAKAWDSTKGASTSPGSYIATHAKFDSYGNQYEGTDALGNTTTTTFDPTYHAFPVTVTSAVPDSGGTHGSNAAFTTSATFDVSTGLPLTTTDANGLTTAVEYDEATLRPRYTRYYDGSTQVGPTNETIYHDESGNSWVKSKSQIDDSHYAEKTAYADGLGRTFKTEELNSQGNIFVEKEFDAEGRVLRVSNPYRSGDTKQWTTNTYDTASRLWKVTTPDSAVVETTYSMAVTGSEIGTVITVTDQAGKLRRSITNVLGQLIRVDEPNSSNQLGSISSPNQPTYYAYDTLNNLTTVTQGSQTRTFAYDSMSRLTQAANPESGTIKYTYDDNSNLKTKWDARGIKTIYDYDALNRVWKRCYKSVGTSSLGYTTCASASGETAEPNTPDVAYTYDNVTNAKGKLTKINSSVSTTEYTSFDILGRVTGAKQTTDGTDYTTSYTYKLNGALDEETYPSGRVVKNVLDNNGDLSIVESGKCLDSTPGTNASCTNRAGFWNYAHNFTYNASRAVTSMQLGNGRWESTSFNSRLQPTQIALGTVQNGTDMLKLDYSYGSTANNGNVLSQTITVPGMTYPLVQNYAYDELNRLSSATETSNGTQTWKQAFTFDRYGNRNFDEANTTTLPKNCGSLPNFTVCAADKKVVDPEILTSNNRIKGDQDGDTVNDYTFDSSGNTTLDAQGRTFIYDGENKQVSVSDSNGTIGEYSYAGDGKRVKKVVPATGETTIFVYDAGGKLVAEYSTIVASTNDAKVNYLTSDHLGSPRITTDQNGAIISRHDYMPFGEEIDGTGGRTTGLSYSGDSVRKQFTGYERDTETGLDFAQARTYNNQHGRFTSADPIIFQIAMAVDPQRFNLYVYTRNSPLKFTDPEGETVKIAPGSSLDEIYQMVGGQKIFDQFFEVQDGLIIARNGADFSNANQGVRFLNELIGRPEVFLVYLGADADAVARLFEGTTKSDGSLNDKGQAIARKFRNDGSLVSTAGRRGLAEQPAGVAFMVIAINAETLNLNQTGVNSFNFGQGFTELGEQLSGVGQRVQAVSLLIHELAENLDFARNGTHSPFSPPLSKGMSDVDRDRYYGYRDYRRAHDYAIRREAMIRRDLHLAGGFAGGSQNGSKLLDWRRP